jgi:spermidine/putrescine transport system permease protein
LFAALLAITVGYLIYRRMTRGDSTAGGGIAAFAGEA